MVNVTHNNNYGSTLNALALIVAVVDKTLFNGNNNFLFNLCAQLFSNERSCIKVDDLVDGAHLAQTHELLNDLGSCYLQSGSKLGNNDLIGNEDFELLLSCTLKLQSAELLSLGLLLAGILLLVSLSRLLCELLLLG